MVSVIFDESYDEGITDDDIFECGKRHPVLSDINKTRIVQALKKRVKSMKNKSWICQICKKYFYGCNNIK